MTCEYCEHDDDNVRGIYVCPNCGSHELVDKADEPTAYDDLLRRLREAVDEMKELAVRNYDSAVTIEQKEAQLIKTSSFDGARHILERLFPELKELEDK